jgi:hypothetical protein
MTDNQSQPKLAPANSPSPLNKFIDWFLDPRRRLSLDSMLVLMIVIGLLRRVWRYAVGFPLWGDESFVAINFYVRDYFEMVEPLVFGQIVPLGFMWATEAATQLFGYSEWALRLIAVLSGLAGFVVFARFCTKNLSPMAAVLALGFMAPAYYVVRHTAEVKAYSTDLLLAIVLISATWRIMKVPTCRTAWGVLILLSLIGPWCSYPFVFVSGGAGLTLAAKFFVQDKLQHKVGLTLTLVFGLLLSGSFVAMYILYAGPHAQAAKDLIAIDLWAQTWPPLAHFWLLPVWFIQIHTGHLFAFPHGGMAPFSGITFVCFLAGVMYFWKRQPLLVVLLVSPFLLNILAAAVHAYPYGAAQRISQHLAPAICILAGQGAFVLGQKLLGSHRLVRFFAGAFVVGGAAYGIAACVVDVVQPYATIDSYRSHQAVRELAELSDPDDQWIIFNAAEPVEHAPWLGDWRGIGAVFAFDVLRFSHQSPIWSPYPSEIDWPDERGDVWLLVYWAVHNRKLPEFPQAQLDAYIADTNSRLGEPAEIKQWLVKGPGKKHESIFAYHYVRPPDRAVTSR